MAPGEQDEKGQGKALGALLVLHLTVYFSQVPLDVQSVINGVMQKGCKLKN